MDKIFDVGDIVCFNHTNIPFEISAAIVGLEGENLIIFSTQLVIFPDAMKKSGVLEPAKITSIILGMTAQKAIPLESRGRNFQKNEPVYTPINGSRIQCRVIAAFDGIVACKTDDMKDISGGALHFYRIE
jgi:hypothetical protein